jgi:ABC-2 type transport system ATP-binding protein
MASTNEPDVTPWESFLPQTRITDSVLVMDQISKRFDRIRALSSLSMEVRRGEVLALLGPNGAGKTTIANLLQGYITPDTGNMTFYMGSTPRSHLEEWEIGYFPGDSSIYRSLPIDRVLFHAATRRGLDPTLAQQRTDRWLERIGLSTRANTALGNLSRGNQQKVQFVEAVIHQPHLLFLDEPFTSLDPVGQELFITLIRELQGQGTTILVSDHQLSLVERIADRIGILNLGRLIALGTQEELRKQANAGIRVRLRLANTNTPINLSYLYAHPSIRVVERTAGGEVRLLTHEDAVPSEVLNFAKKNLPISEILSEPATLHDIYVKLIGADNSQIAARQQTGTWFQEIEND